MTPEDLTVRRETYRLFVAGGRAPATAEVAESLSRTEADVLASWRRLHDEHALVLDQEGTGIRMANPFSGVPTAFRVRATERWWYANCAWDAFGVCAALGVDGRIETRCADCGDPMTVEVHAQRPDDPSLVFHCLVPARHWWDDIGFT